jgi:hypothetical protein
MIRAFCYPSGLIEFGRSIPKGAKIIARGPEQELRDFIAAKARCYGHLRSLLVPGVPEADNAIAASDALKRWTTWIAIGAPKGVRVLSS